MVDFWTDLRTKLLGSMPFVLGPKAEELGEPPARVLAVLAKMYEEGLCKMTLNVYHPCRAAPVAVQSWETGFYEANFRCPICGDMSSGKLTFDVLAESTYSASTAP